MARRSEAADQAHDRLNALQAIGRVIADGTATPKAKLHQITGILRMHDAEPPAARIEVRPSIDVAAAMLDDIAHGRPTL